VTLEDLLLPVQRQMIRSLGHNHLDYARSLPLRRVSSGDGMRAADPQS
jgi:hypothetical protein